MRPNKEANMQIDERISKLAKNILKNSVQLKKGEKIYIEAFGASTKDFFNELIKATIKPAPPPSNTNDP